MLEPDSGRYELAGDLYVFPTPAGAYHAVSSTEPSDLRAFLHTLLQHDESPLASTENLRRWLKTDDDQAALELLHRAQTLAWIEGYDAPTRVSEQGVGVELKQLLPKLSATARGMLVDWNGLPLTSCGIDEKTGDTLAALAADLIGVQERHAERLAQHLGRASHGWAAVDAYGSSRIGAWPLYIGDKRILLVLLGEPMLNQPAFVDMVWLLIRNYG